MPKTLKASRPKVDGAFPLSATSAAGSPRTRGPRAWTARAAAAKAGRLRREKWEGAVARKDLALKVLNFQVRASRVGDHPTARSFYDEAFLDKVRLVNFFQRVFFFRQSGRQSFDTDRATGKFLVDEI